MTDGENASTLQDEIRSTLEDLLDDGHDIQDVFDALDTIYDEFDQRASEDALTTVPIFEAEVIVPDQKATSGEAYETRTIDECLTEEAAASKLIEDPAVKEVVDIEQTDTMEVYM